MQAKTKYLVIIESGGASTALLFTAERRQTGEFDAGSEEVAVMTRGLTPSHTAAQPEWDSALAGSSRAEREAASVYPLDI